MKPLPYWLEIAPHPITAIIQATGQYHQAAQFIAMAGNHLLPHKEDDSQTNMEWWPDHGSFAGRRIPADRSFRLVVETEEFRLAFYEDARHRRETLSIHGLTRDEVYTWVKENIRRKGLEVNGFDYITHYQIPDHPVMEGTAFEAPTQSSQEVITSYRNNAELIISHYAVKFRQSSSIRIWPHHFDTGCFIPIDKTNGAVTHFLIIGMNIPDDMVNDYYFYVTHGMTQGSPDYSSQKPFVKSGTWHVGDWKGASLKMGEIAGMPTMESQAEAVREFFEHAINQSLTFIGKNPD